MQKRLRNLATALLLGVAGSAQCALLETSFPYNVTSYNDGITRDAMALVTQADNFGAERRPVILAMPGWGGIGDVLAGRDGYTALYANNGYVVVNIGFHNTNKGAYFSSDLAESARAALETVCAATFVDCTAVVLTGVSYGAAQTHPVLRFLRGNGVFDGSAGPNAGRRVVGLLAQDAGYTLHYEAPVDADATAYSIAMIENQGDAVFPIDGCDYGNCGARNRGDYHQGAAGSQYVLSYCPPGGSHGTRAGQWDAWVLSAMKTMIHNHRGVAKFTGYVEPSLAPSNSCVTAAAPALQTTTALASGTNPSIVGQSVTFTATVTSASGTPTGAVAFKDGATVLCAAVALVSTQAQCSTAALSVATHSITADYAGDALFAPSTSPPLSQVVQPPPGFTLTVNRSGNGTVTSSPAGVSCGATCAATFGSGSGVTLSAAPATDSIFSGWSGGGCTGTGMCSFTMNAPITVNATFNLATTIPRLAGISTRMQVLTGDSVMIGGFIIGGSTPKKVVVRARGPSLGIAGALADPTLTLVPSSGPAVTNDDWQSAPNQVQLFASGYSPAHPKESAIMATLDPGAYTAIVSGVGGTTGLAIVEVYELDHPEIPLVGISTRGRVGTGDNVVIGGFIIQGDSPQTVVVRARGPSLGVAGAIADPVLTLVPASGPAITNDNWQTESNSATLAASGFAPGDPRESALLITLAPGPYTAIVTGAGGSTGLAIIEVYKQ